MTASAPASPAAAPRAVLLVPVAVLLHQVEEWFGGFPGWVSTALGADLSPERFLSVNAVGLVIFAAGALAASVSPQLVWLGVSLAAWIGINGVLHGVGSLATWSYSPGTVTGLVLFVPVSAVVLHAAAGRLSRAAFAGSAVLGVAAHALGTLTALS